MIMTKNALHRRTFLRGMGATLALPLLDSMIPALSAMAKAAKPVMRLGFYYVSNGCTMRDWHPKGEGRNFEISPILRPLAPFQDQLIVVKGLANQAADGGSGAHTRSHAVWLNGVTPKKTEGADVQAGITIDQYAATKLGAGTPLTSLELALEPNDLVGNCDNGYSCVYENTFSWRTPTLPLPMETNPRVVFERLFGDGRSPTARISQMRRHRSILDGVAEDWNRLKQVVGPSDRRTVGEYLESVRDVELRLQKAEQQVDVLPPDFERPLGIPLSDDEHARMMFDLQFLAYRADITRVSTFQISREQSGRTYPQVGVPQAHHDASHHQFNPEKMTLNSKINTYHVSLFAELVRKMRETPDGDGSLLDHAILLYGGGMGNGNEHISHDLPLVLVGGGCGAMQGGQILSCPVDTPMMNLGLSLLDKVGVELPSLGDSTGRLAGL